MRCELPVGTRVRIVNRSSPWNDCLGSLTSSGSECYQVLIDTMGCNIRVQAAEIEEVTDDDVAVSSRFAPGDRVRVSNKLNAWFGSVGVLIDVDQERIYCSVRLDDHGPLIHPYLVHIEPLSGVERLGEISTQGAQDS